MKFLFLILGILLVLSAQAAPTLRSRSLQLGIDAEVSTRGQFSSSGGVFATMSYFFNEPGNRYGNVTRTFHAWNTHNGAPIARWKLRTMDDFTLSPDGQTVAIVTSTWYQANPVTIYGVELRDMRSGRLKRALIRAGTVDANIYALAWSRDGRLLATGSGDGLARVWNVNTGRRVTTLLVRGTVGAVAFSPDGQWLATVGRSTQLWNFRRKKVLSRTRFGEYAHYATLKFSPDGKRLAVGNLAAGQTILYGVPSLESLGKVPPIDQINAGFTPRVAFSGDARLIAFLNGTNLDIRRGSLPQAVARYNVQQNGKDYVTTIQFTPNNRLMWATLHISRDETLNIVWKSPKLWSAPLQLTGAN